MLIRMLEEHRRIAGVARQLAVFLESSEPPVAPEFATARWTLARELLRHMAEEESFLDTQYRRLARKGKDQAPDRQHPHELQQHFRQHMVMWNPPRIAAEWDRYRQEMADILKSLKRQMEFEEKQIYPELSATRPDWAEHSPAH